MSMRSRIAKGTSYAVAPRTTFTFLQPRLAVIAGLAGRLVKRVRPASRRRARVRTAMKGVGAAAVALPIGLWLGRKMWSGQEQNEIPVGAD